MVELDPEPEESAPEELVSVVAAAESSPVVAVGSFAVVDALVAVALLALVDVALLVPDGWPDAVKLVSGPVLSPALESSGSGVTAGDSAKQLQQMRQDKIQRRRTT